MWRNFGQESGGGGIRPDERVAPLPSRIPRGHARQDAATTLPDLRESVSVGAGNRNSYAVSIGTSAGCQIHTYLVVRFFGFSSTCCGIGCLHLRGVRIEEIDSPARPVVHDQHRPIDHLDIEGVA